MIDEELEIEEVTAGVELSKSVLKKMSGHDERWAKVKARYFNIKDYQAHHDYHHTIINLLKSKHKLKKLLCEKRNPTKRDLTKLSVQTSVMMKTRAQIKIRFLLKILLRLSSKLFPKL